MGRRRGRTKKLCKISKFQKNLRNFEFDAKTRGLLVAERSPYSTQLEIDTLLSFWLPIPFIPASLSTPEKR